ncbi:replication-relaxation family protein [Dactylosporangium sp. NPDC049140]|uniref:replication-relaxation family protein n=1 Tax=Dactylosporangium sp. NPDC049140 TaxID=3155647 RepID=UPI0034079F3C
MTRARPAATPRRSTTRQSTLSDDLLAVSWRLEPRDYVLAHLLDQHRFLTTDQIAAVLYRSPRTCRNRLNVLRQIGFVDWFMPVHPSTGRLPVHWVPGRLSARYVALYHGRPAPSSRALRETRDRYPSAATRVGHLAHADGVNQFFIDLLAYSRHHPTARLTRWWSAGRTYAKVDHNTRPDAHGVWTEDGHEVAFFLEHDTGSESHPARAEKLTGYRTLQDKGPTWPVLFWLPSTTIEANLHRHLTGLAGGTLGVRIATAARDHAAEHGGPAGPVWRVVGNGRRRLRLAELPGRPGPEGPFHPGPPEPDEDPLYLLRGDTPPTAV